MKKENKIFTVLLKGCKAVFCLLLAFLMLCSCENGEKKTSDDPKQDHSFEESASDASSLKEESLLSTPSKESEKAPSDPSSPLPLPTYESPTEPSPTSEPSDDTPYLQIEGDRQGTVAVWWWNKGHAAKANRKKYLEFLQKNGVNEIYICWPDFKREHLADFVKAAGERGIGVSLLSGDASWIDPQNDGADRVIDDFLAYQQGAQQGERLLSLHMDVEPHQLADFWSDQQNILEKYADFVEKTAKKVRAQGERIEWDIPFWFDGYTVREETPLLEHLAENADTLCLMSYRDSAEAVLECSEKELEIGAKYGCRVVCGLETYSAEGDHVSFMEEGKGYMYGQCKTLYGMLSKRCAPEKFGIAIHYLDTWFKMKD